MKGGLMKLLGNLFLFMLLFLSLAIRPARPEILQTEGEKYYFEQGLEYFRAEEYELALKNFLEALELNPENKLALKYVSMIGNELKKREEQELLGQAVKDYYERNYEAAVSKFVQVLDLNPRNREAIDYIQKIKNETSGIEEVGVKVISEEEKPEAEKVVSQEISKIAQDIEI
ncbi:MAG: tetratricopeptide repeat protein, partial [bacterium]